MDKKIKNLIVDFYKTRAVRFEESFIASGPAIALKFRDAALQIELETLPGQKIYDIVIENARQRGLTPEAFLTGSKNAMN